MSINIFFWNRQINLYIKEKENMENKVAATDQLQYKETERE